MAGCQGPCVLPAIQKEEKYRFAAIAVLFFLSFHYGLITKNVQGIDQASEK